MNLFAFLLITVASALAPTISLCESVPRQMDIKVEMTTTGAWAYIINNAKSTLDIAQYYWTLTDGASLDSAYGGEEGMLIYQSLIEASRRGVKVRIVQNIASSSQPQTDTQNLQALGYAQVRSLDFSKFGGNLSTGILHTKMMVADDKNVYIGSANADWRSLTQVKELGIFVANSTDVGNDFKKLFVQYWDAAESNSLPNPWSTDVYAQYNKENPLSFIAEGEKENTLYYTSSSPVEFCAPKRTDALDAILDIIHSASKNISIEVMDYLPTTLYMKPNSYWADIDTALRDAHYRGVKVRLLVSKWDHTKSTAEQYLMSLNDLKNIEVRYYVCPLMTGVSAIPYTRVNHAKFVVTESTTYISNNNWTGDYFLSTAGLSSVIQSKSFVTKVQNTFDRDWTSKYASPL